MTRAKHALHVKGNSEAEVKEPLVSVVIPTFNNAETIERTLSSVFLQTYKNLEIIVSDHASTDATLSVLARFSDDQRFTVLHFKGKAGAHLNWNFVSSIARGDYITLVCGDDLLLPRAIEVKVLALEHYSSAVIAGTRRSIVDDESRVLVRGRGLGPLIGLKSGEESVKACVRAGANLFGEPMCVMFRRRAFERSGGWEADLPYVIDQGTYFKILRHGDFVGIPEVLASFRLSRTQLSYRLVRSQSKQVKQLHQKASEVFGFKVSAAELALGNVRATVNAWIRRLLYLFL